MPWRILKETTELAGAHLELCHRNPDILERVLNRIALLQVNNPRNTVFILGDSIVKNVNGYLLTKKLRHKKLIKVRSFSGAKVSCMYDHVKPTSREFNPNHIILHVGLTYWLEKMERLDILIGEAWHINWRKPNLNAQQNHLSLTLSL